MLSGLQVKALLAAILVSMVLGSLYTFAAVAPYISSYLYYQGEQISTISFSLVFALIIIFEDIGIPIEALLSKKVSNRILCLISTSGLGLSFFLASFMTNFIGIVTFMGVFSGIFIGVGYLPPIKNAYLHLPHRKGLCAGLSLSGFGFGTILFNYLLVMLINPHNEEVNHQTKRFPQQIANNVPFGLKIFGAVILSVGVLGSLMITPPNKKHQSFIRASKAIQKQIYSFRHTNEQNFSYKHFYEQYFEKRGYFLTLHLFLTTSFGMLIASNYKQIAFQLNNDFQSKDHLITIIGSIGSLANGCSRLIWGTLFDKFSFKTLYSLINGILIVACGVIIFAAKNIVSYGFLVTIVYFCYGGSFALMPTQTIRVFGEEIGGKLYFLVFSGSALASVTQFLVHYLIVDILNHTNSYLFCFIIFGFFNLCALIMSLRIKYCYCLLEQNLIEGRKSSTTKSSDSEHLIYRND